MSIEQALAENTASNLAVASAIAANTAILEKLEAGREAALAQLEQKNDKPARASRKPKEEAAAGNDAGGATAGSTVESPPASPSPAAATDEVQDADLRAAATAYIEGANKITGTDDEKTAERKTRGGNIKAITDHFGTKTLVGETGIKDADQKAQALFYLKRFTAGLEVNFSAEYDFAGDPAQGGAAEADAEFDGIG